MYNSILLFTGTVCMTKQIFLYIKFGTFFSIVQFLIQLIPSIKQYN